MEAIARIRGLSAARREIGPASFVRQESAFEQDAR
jgi:hypothetical protein